MGEMVVNRLKDPENITDTEKKHVPLIESPDLMTVGGSFDVKIQVGSIPHVMEEGHFIEWIELSLGEEVVGKVELSESNEPVATFTLVPEERLIASEQIESCYIHGFNVCGECGTRSVIISLVARAHCNVHGLWEAEKKVEVMSRDSDEGKKCTWEA